MRDQGAPRARRVPVVADGVNGHKRLTNGTRLTGCQTVQVGHRAAVQPLDRGLFIKATRSLADASRRVRIRSRRSR
jgi:hypothetical protein